TGMPVACDVSPPWYVTCAMLAAKSSRTPGLGPSPLAGRRGGGMDGKSMDLTQAVALVRVAIGAVVGVCAALLDVIFGPTKAAPLVGWDALALTYLSLTWWLIWPLNWGRTAQRATRHDPTRAVSYVLLLTAALASVLALGLVLFGASRSSGTAEA